MVNKMVLIVDDDLSLCDNLRDILQDEGYEPFSSGTIAEGLKLARERRPEMVLLDLKLPDGQGTTLLTDLKRENPDCICIIMTAYADLDSAVAAVEKGAYHYLQKPIRHAELLRLLGGAFEKIQLREQKRQTEEALRRNEELLRDFLDNASDLIQVVDPSVRFLYVNRKWLEVLGYTSDEAFKLSLSDIIHPDSFDHCYNIFQRLLAGETLDRLETIFVTKDGKEICVEGSVSCRFENEKPVNIRGIFRDITERKQMEDEILKKNEELESFVFAVSHDLKSPLVSLRGFVGTLIEENKDILTPRNKHITERIVANVAKMEELISDLLDLSRVGRISGPAVRINVRDMLEKLSRSYAIRLKEKEIKLKITAKEDCVIQADRKQMIKVLDNLMSNAVKSMGDTKAPKIGLLCDCRNESRLRICVKDNGIGIDPKYHEKIFEIFKRLNVKNTEGTGVGLALVKKIVEGLGGRVWVEAELGKGAEFWIELPISH